MTARLAAKPLPPIRRRPPHPARCGWMALLVAAALLPAPARAQTPCAEVVWADSIPWGTARAYRIERALAAAYPPDDAGARRIDGAFDAGTLDLLDRFCADVRADGSTLLASVDSFAVAVAAYPGWRDTIASPAFVRWARSQSMDRNAGRVVGRKPQAPGAALLIDRYLVERKDGFFYLTADEIQSLGAAAETELYGVVAGTSQELAARGAPAALVDRITALETLGYRYPNQDSLDVRLDAIFTLDDAPVVPQRDPDELDAALLIVEEALAQAPSAGPPAQPSYRDFVDIGVRRSADHGPAIGQAARNGLMQLADKRFPNADLFRTAVRLTSGIGVARPAELARVMALARKAALRTPAEMADSLGLQPLAWDGGSCGCGVFEGAPDQSGQYFYGIYPFWAAPQRLAKKADKVAIEFSQLSRLAYYGMTFDARGELVDTLHWRMGRYPADSWPFFGREQAAFSIKAHDYKSQMDLVVYNSDWTAYLPTDSSSAAVQAAKDATASAFTTLRTRLLDVISPRLPDFVDKIKPWVTFGQSPTSTLGDGITLDFDLDGLSNADQSALYDNLEQVQFFEQLRHDMDARGGNDLFFDFTPEYQLQVIVPVHCIAALGTPHECGFYSMQHLDSMSDSVHLFLVDMNAQSPDSSLDLSHLSSLRERARRMREGIERYGNVMGTSKARNFSYKLIPLANPQQGDIGTFFREIEPFFAGAGSWSLPTDPVYHDSLDAVFFAPPLPPGNLPKVTSWVLEHVTTYSTSLDTTVCGVMCPLRWWVRLLILIGSLAALVLWLVSEVNFSRKQIFETRAFLIFALGMAALLMSTLWCDPFWDQHHGWILLMFVVAGLSLMVKSRTRLKRQRHYP